MAKSNKPIVWSLFAAGGTLAAFLAPVLALLFVLLALGHTPNVLTYEGLRAVAGHWFGKLFLFGVIALFLWHAAHRLRVTVYDFGLRADTLAAVIVYLTAATGTVLTVLYLLRV